MIALISLLFVASQVTIGLFLLACLKLAGKADERRDQMPEPPWLADVPDSPS